MSASLGSIILALVAFLAKIADFAKAINARKQEDINYTLRKSKQDLEKLLLAIKTRRKVKNEISRPNKDGSNSTHDSINQLRKLKDRYQR